MSELREDNRLADQGAPVAQGSILGVMFDFGFGLERVPTNRKKRFRKVKQTQEDYFLIHPNLRGRLLAIGKLNPNHLLKNNPRFKNHVLPFRTSSKSTKSRQG